MQYIVTLTKKAGNAFMLREIRYLVGQKSGKYLMSAVNYSVKLHFGWSMCAVNRRVRDKVILSLCNEKRLNKAPNGKSIAVSDQKVANFLA